MQTATGGTLDALQLAVDHGRVAVRHSKHPPEAVLIYTPAEWRAFIAGAKAGEFDPSGPS